MSVTCVEGCEGGIIREYKENLREAVGTRIGGAEIEMGRSPESQGLQALTLRIQASSLFSATRVTKVSGHFTKKPCLLLNGENSDIKVIAYIIIMQVFRYFCVLKY